MSDAIVDEFILGTYEHTLDPKGRLILPALYRDRFAAGVHLTTGPDNTVQVWTVDEFRSAVREAMALPTGSELGRRRRRAITGAVVTAPDAQGRVLIPQRLREAAGLDRELTLLGNGDHFEIWDRARYAAYEQRTVEIFGEGYDDDLGR
jgi:MraZ protein